MAWPKGRKRPEFSGESNPTKRPDVREKLSKSWTEDRKKKQLVGENSPWFGKKNPKASERMLRDKPTQRFDVRLKIGNTLRGRKNPTTQERMKNGGAAYAASFCRNISRPQIKLFEVVRKFYSSAVLNYVYQNYCIDIVIPEISVAIEYDGPYWHRDKDKDRKRQIEIEKGGWRFLRYERLPTESELQQDVRRICSYYWII